MKRTVSGIILVVGILIGALVAWAVKADARLTSSIISLGDSSGRWTMIDKTEFFRLPRDTRKFAAWLIVNTCSTEQQVSVENFRQQGWFGKCDAEVAADEARRPFTSLEGSVPVEPKSFALILLTPKPSPELKGTTWCYDLLVGEEKADPRLKFDP